MRAIDCEFSVQGIIEKRTNRGFVEGRKHCPEKVRYAREKSGFSSLPTSQYCEEIIECGLVVSAAHGSVNLLDAFIGSKRHLIRSNANGSSIFQVQVVDIQGPIGAELVPSQCK